MSTATILSVDCNTTKTILVGLDTSKNPQLSSIVLLISVVLNKRPYQSMKFVPNAFNKSVYLEASSNSFFFIFLS